MGKKDKDDDNSDQKLIIFSFRTEKNRKKKTATNA